MLLKILHLPSHGHKALETIAIYAPEKIQSINTEHMKRELSRRTESNPYNETAYYFNFNLLVNDINFSGNNISVQIDDKTGDIQSFSVNWNDSLDFPDMDNLIDKQKARKLFLGNHTLELIYL